VVEVSLIGIVVIGGDECCDGVVISSSVFIVLHYHCRMVRPLVPFMPLSCALFVVFVAASAA